MQAMNERYKTLRLMALKHERERLFEKGVPLHAPRMLKLTNMIKRLGRELQQADLFEVRAESARSGEVRSGGDTKAAAGATVQTAKS